MEIKEIGGDVCSPKGFLAAGVHCGIRKNREKKDLAMIYSDVPCTVACTYTQNKVKGAPILVTQKNVANGVARAVIINSGNANTCNPDGVEIATQMCALTAKALAIDPADVVVASTGVIGQPLSIEPIAAGITPLVKALSKSGGKDACEGIMTTDTVEKLFAYETVIGGSTVTLGAMVKGSGMIRPNMATMLAFVTTDAAISAEMLQKAVKEVVADTFNMVSVDGDTSTNDMLTCMASGLAGNAEITAEGADLEGFKAALYEICRALSRAIAKDGEGATKLLECSVTGAPDTACARIVAKAVVCSSLLKAAMFGADANWGRVLCAIGYAEADFDIQSVDVAFDSSAGSVAVCKNGAGVPFSEEEAKKVLMKDEIGIRIDMKQGTGVATAWGCDLTYDYVKINGDYRT